MCADLVVLLKAKIHIELYKCTKSYASNAQMKSLIQVCFCHRQK